MPINMKFSEFPHDMQVLIDQMTEDAGVERAADDAMIPVGMVPTSSFPARIQGHAIGDERQFEHYLETPAEEYPPVLVAHGFWLDGRHRLWAARARGVEEIKTADISSLLPRSYVQKARFLGRMRKPVRFSSQDPPALSLAKRAAIHLYQTDEEFVVGGCSDVSEVISAWLQKKGYQVKPVYGAARKGRKPWFLHAWMDIEGQRFDPVLWVQGMDMSKYRYTVDPEVAKALRCDVEYIIEGEVEALDRAIT